MDAVLLIELFALYFFPTIVAFANDKRNRGAVGLLNALLGWTVIGWIIALIWAVAVDNPPVEGAKRRMGAGAAYGGAVVLLMVLVGTVSSRYESTKSSTASPAKTSMASTSAAQSGLPQTKWTEGLSQSQMDGSKTVTLTLQADNEVQGWLSTKTPYLYIRCKEHKTDVAVYTGMAASVEQGADYSLDHHTVRLRFDNGHPVTESWLESTNDEALFAPNPIGLSRRIARASTFRFQFTPFSANPQVITFGVQGLNKYLPDVAKACGWKYAGNR